MVGHHSPWPNQENGGLLIGGGAGCVDDVGLRRTARCLRRRCRPRRGNHLRSMQHALQAQLCQLRKSSRRLTELCHFRALLRHLVADFHQLAKVARRDRFHCGSFVCIVSVSVNRSAAIGTAMSGMASSRASCAPALPTKLGTSTPAGFARVGGASGSFGFAAAWVTAAGPPTLFVDLDTPGFPTNLPSKGLSEWRRRARRLTNAARFGQGNV